MWSVPFDYIQYSDCFAVGVFERNTECDYGLYDTMYNHENIGLFTKGIAEDQDLTYRGSKVTIKSSMTNSEIAALKVNVLDSDHN